MAGDTRRNQESSSCHGNGRLPFVVRNRMELYQIRYFVALSQALNFTRAAEICNVTQPALTKAVKKLEEELGGELIYRERQFTRLTELGRIVVPKLEELLTLARAVRQSAESFRSGKETSLKVGLSPCVSAALLTPLMQELVAIHPALGVDLIEAPLSELFGRLVQGEIGAAIIGDLDNVPVQVHSFPLFEERLVVLTCERNPLARLSAIPVGDLQDQTWLDRPNCKIATRFWRQHFGSGSMPKVSHRGRHIGHLQEMIAADLGIMLAPEHTPTVGRVVARSIEGNSTKRTVHLVIVNGRSRSPALESFVGVARKHDWIAHVESVRNQNIPLSCVNDGVPPKRRQRDPGDHSRAPSSNGMSRTAHQRHVIR
jgi:DNA-binding transcriptional LysR family regulator